MSWSNSASSAVELLAAHDGQVRASIEGRMPAGWRGVRDGRLLLVRTHHRGFIFTDGLTDLSDRDIAALVARGRAFFAANGEAVEWKAYGHDHPALAKTLAVAGFVAEPTETVLVARSADLVDGSTAPAGIVVRRVVDRGDFARIAEMESAVWGADWSWLAEDLSDRQASDPSAISVYVAEAAGAVVSAGWLVVLPGTSFAGLWGGSTLPAWRRRGVYRALVGIRAAEAERRGIEFLWVDASDDSRPILQRLGMTAVSTTTPWIWTPAP